MAYSKQTWHDQPTQDTPVSAARLGHIEDGIEATAIVADAALPASGLAAAVAALLTSNFPAGLTTDTELATAVANAIAAEVTRANAAYVAGTGLTADLSAASHRITNLLDPSSPQDAATRAYVLAQISALVNGAPGLLDTLGEIAAQLATDESAVGALTTTLALKAPLASPAFTGTPTAPTAAPGTSTTQLATTAFVVGQTATYQPLDSDLTTIAALDASTAGVLSTDGSGWIRKTYAQVKTALGLVKADVGLGNVDNTSDVNKPVSTAQQTALDAKMAALTVTPVKTANYTLAANEAARFDTTSGSLTATLPTTPADKTLALVKNVIQGGTNTVTIACGGSDTFNRTGGATTYVLALLAQGALMEYRAADATWTIIADDLALSQLDLRYALLSTVTTKGDLLAATAAGVLARLGVGSNTQVLTADSTAATGMKWAAAGGSASSPLLFGVRASNINRVPQIYSNQVGGVSLTDGRLYALPVLILAQTTITKLGLALFTNGSTGAVFRVGIYADAGGYPGALLYDAGTVSTTTGATGFVTVTLAVPQSVAAGSIFVAGVAQGAATTAAQTVTVRGISSCVNANGYSTVAGYYTSGVTGALPTTFPAGATVADDSANVPVLAMGA